MITVKNITVVVDNSYSYTIPDIADEDPNVVFSQLRAEIENTIEYHRSGQAVADDVEAKEMEKLGRE